MFERAPNLAELLETDADDPAFGALRARELTGRQLGDAAFVARIEAALGRRAAPGKRGRRPMDIKGLEAAPR